MLKHIGKIVNTDQRCLVVFMQIPGREDHALVVSTDNLPPRFEQAVMDIVKSPEAQNSRDLGPVLGRRILPDTRENVMEALHNYQLLRAVHVDQVVMLPLPNMPFPLRQVLESMGQQPARSPEIPVIEEKFNPHDINTKALDAETRVAIAKNKLAEAEMLMVEVERKRQEAYTYAPELAPKAEKVIAVETVEVKAKTTRKSPSKKKAAKETGLPLV